MNLCRRNRGFMGKMIVFSLSAALAAMSVNDMASASLLELATVPQTIYLEKINGRVNYAFHLIFRNHYSDPVRLESARVTYHMNGNTKRLLLWDGSYLRGKSLSANTLIPASGTLLLKGLGEELEIASNGFTIDMVFAFGLTDGTMEEYTFNIPVRQYRQKTTFSLPFSRPWYVVNGRGIHEGHRLAAQGQSFAWDFTYRPHGRDCRLKELKPETKLTPEDFYAFGQPVLAPAEGKVIKIENQREDEIPTIVYSPYLWKAPDNPDEILGNYVVIRHQDHEFSLLAHLQKGSVVVKPYEQVHQGQMIAKCGNSGDSTYPHIHFQVMDGPDHFRSQGLPIRVSDFRLEREDERRAIRFGVPLKGDIVENMTPTQSRLSGERP